MAGLVKRGQVWVADLNPGFGAEIHKKRPVLIISNHELNRYLPSIIVVPISSQTKPLGPEKVLLPKDMAGLEKESAVLTPGIRTIDKKRLIKKLGEISQDYIEQVEAALLISLGITKLD